MVREERERKILVRNPEPDRIFVVSKRAFFNNVLLALAQTGSVFVNDMSRFQAYRFAKRAKSILGANVTYYTSIYQQNGVMYNGYWFRVIPDIPIAITKCPNCGYEFNKIK